MFAIEGRDPYRVVAAAAGRDEQTPINGGGFLSDNDAGKRARNPCFCGVVGGVVVKDATYRAADRLSTDSCEG
ncbi:MAG: hypothetical protein WD795_15995 [Woeseia sp.]